MKLSIFAAELCVLTLALGCGSKSSQDKEPVATNPNAIPLSLVQSEVIARPDNLMSCETLHSDSVICSYGPNLGLPTAVSESPTLVKIRYSLKCMEGASEELSSIALQSDSQVRRLQINVEDRVISILSKHGSEINLAKVLQNEEVTTLNGQSSCWYLKIEVVDQESFASEIDAEGAQQEEGIQ